MDSADPIACGLPHRAPFIFVDKVRALEVGRSAICEKFFAADTPFFAGHFPGQPLVPGVILTEGMAQTAGLAAGCPGTSFRLSAIKQMKFLKPVWPDSLVIFHAEQDKEMGSLRQFATKATFLDVTVAEGVIVLAEVEAI